MNCKGKCKRFIAILVLLCVVLVQIGLPYGANVFAAVDVLAPVIDNANLSIESTGTSAGSIVKISVPVTDEMSGVGDVIITYVSPITKKWDIQYMIYNSSTGKYEYTKVITEETEKGIWCIYSISASDNQSNISSLYNTNETTFFTPSADLIKGNFEVTGTTADVIAPVIDNTNLSLESTGTTAGSTVKISVPVTDKMSGVGHVTLTYVSPITKKWDIQNMTYNSSTCKYEYTKVITEETEKGIWCIYSISVSDNQSNISSLYNMNQTTFFTPSADLIKGNYEVMGTASDVIAPVIDNANLSIESTGTTAGSTVKISVPVIDKMSGVGDVTLTYVSPITKKWDIQNMTYNSATGKYEYTKVITEDTENGIWSIYAISASDNQSNISNLYNTHETTFFTPRADLSC